MVGSSIRQGGAMFRPAIGLLLLALPLSAQTVEIILDASGSMNAPLEGSKTRIAAAREALEKVVATLPDATRVALRAYGHGSPRAKHDCSDTAVLVPFGAVSASRAKLIAAAKNITVQGYTPITRVLELAAKDFEGQPAGSRAIILVSDGRETCAGDPCAMARALRAADVDLVIHTVGLGVDAAARQELECIARSTGGTYFSATSVASLSEALSTAVARRATIPVVQKKGDGKLRIKNVGSLGSHAIFDGGGKKVSSLDAANTVAELPAGIYSVQFGPVQWRGIEVRAGETTTIEPGLLKVSGLATLGTATVVEPETDAVLGTVNQMSTKVALLPGTYLVRFGKVAEWPHVRVDSGLVTELKAARIKVTNLASGSVRILDAAGRVVATVDPVNQVATLPPGAYTIQLPGGVKPVIVAEGSVMEVSAK
jgi:hypothetical protein